MMKEIKSVHFEKKYFEEIDHISEDSNYFTPILHVLHQHIDVKSAKVLDVGCGTGLFFKPLVSAGCSELYGVDGSHGFIDRAVKRGYKQVIVIPDLNINSLPFNDKEFDLIVCKDVFEHLLNPKHVLAEICRVVKDGGLVLIHVPNHFPLEGRIKFLITNNIDTFKYFNSEGRWDFPHIRFFEYRDLLKVIEENGLCLVNDLSHHFLAIPWFSKIKIFMPFYRYMVERYPNEFTSGFTFLLRRV